MNKKVILIFKSHDLVVWEKYRNIVGLFYLTTKNQKMNFDQNLYQELKKQYESSLKNNIEVFNFHGNDILTSYAKYLLQYLSTHFENK